MSTETSLAAFCVLMTACSPHKVQRNPAPPVAVPTSYSTSLEGKSSNRWWKDLGDPQLSSLIEGALADNLQVKSAWARLAQAAALADQAGAARWPQLQASFDGAYQQQFNPLVNFGGAPPGIDRTFEVESYSLSAAASYEVDLFKKLGNQASGAALEALAARDQVEALAMTLAAQIADAWYALVAQRAQRLLLLEQIEVSEMFLELAEMRIRQGLGTVIDVYQQRQQVAAVRAQVPLSESAIAVLEHQLALLVGKPPGRLALGERDELPQVPALPSTGVPADLLVRRPDVRAAQKRVEAADYRVAVAVANRLPSLRLSGSAGFQDNSLGDLLKTPVWTIAGSLLAPIFNAGRLKAEVRRSEAEVRDLLYQFGQALLEAMVEVENALVQEKKQIEHLEALGKQVELANETLKQARARYRDGIGEQGFLQVLTSQQSQQQAELELLQARRQVLSYRIQLYRALGGTWTRELNPKGENSDE